MKPSGNVLMPMTLTPPTASSASKVLRMSASVVGRNVVIMSARASSRKISSAVLSLIFKSRPFSTQTASSVLRIWIASRIAARNALVLPGFFAA